MSRLWVVRWQSKNLPEWHGESEPMPLQEARSRAEELAQGSQDVVYTIEPVQPAQETL